MQLIGKEIFGGLPTTTHNFTPKSDLWCHFFEIF